MKTLHILFCSVLLAPMVALSQSKPVTIFINTATKPASAGGETKLFADSFEGQVSQQLRDKYPCAQTTSAADVGAVLDWDRQRELMGGDIGDAELKDIAGSVGAKYLISLTVTELGSGQLSLKASMVDTTTTPLQTQANSTSITSGGEAAYDAIKALATQFVDSLSGLSQFSKENCNPTNQWTGTITYHLDAHPPDQKGERTSSAGDGKGTVAWTFTTSDYCDVTIHVGWTGRPQATIVATNSENSEEVAKIRIDCGRPSIVRTPVWKSAGWRELILSESTASGNGEASVSVTLADGRYRIALGVPEIEGTVKITRHKHYDGGCGKPNDTNPAPIEVPWKIKKPLPIIDKPLGKPDKLKGGDTDAFGGIITWDLTRTPMRE
jgi:hypothetical protein